MTSTELKDRTKKYAINVLKMLKGLPRQQPYFAITDQLCRSSMSVGANYRAAVRAKSTKDFINKLKIVEEECDETLYFMEVLGEISTEKQSELDALRKEGNEILSIIVASINTSKRKLNESKNQ
jgi:four helix bundle protein